MEKVLKKIYVIAFMTVLFVPFLLAHREENRISESENRYYANVPKVFDEDGKFNQDYIQDFEEWINDNVRFRSLFRELKVTALYHLFGFLDMEEVRVGTNGELYRSTMNDVETMQGRDLLSDSGLELYEANLYHLQNWLAEKNIGFYYMHGYNKMTVLDQYYPAGMIHYDTPYIGEHTENYLVEKDRVHVVPLYQLLNSTAQTENIYYKYYDEVHWNTDGMYLGYEKLMKTIQEKYPDIDYLTKEDYRIEYRKEYRDVYGFLYPLAEEVPGYWIKEAHAKETENEMYDRFSVKSHTHYFQNTNAARKILMINDSFVRMKMKEHLAESFGESLSVDLTNLENIEWIVEEYQPDIVLLETVETSIPLVFHMLNELECIKK